MIEEIKAYDTVNETDTPNPENSRRAIQLIRGEYTTRPRNDANAGNENARTIYVWTIFLYSTNALGGPACNEI
jgi:hypothetical protein